MSQPAPDRRHGFLSAGLPSISRYRLAGTVVFDALAWFFSLFVAAFLRFEYAGHAIASRELLVVAAIAALHPTRFRLAPSLPSPLADRKLRGDHLPRGHRAIDGLLVLLTLAFGFRRHAPLGVVLAAGAFTLMITAGGRCIWRLIWEYRIQVASSGEGVVVFGAGVAGRQLIDALLTNPGAHYVPVALFDRRPDQTKPHGAQPPGDGRP